MTAYKIVERNRTTWYKPRVNQIFSDGKHTYIYIGRGDMYYKHYSNVRPEYRKKNSEEQLECYINLDGVDLKRGIIVNFDCIDIATIELKVSCLKNPRKAYEIIGSLNPDITTYNNVRIDRIASIKMDRRQGR